MRPGVLPSIARSAGIHALGRIGILFKQADSWNAKLTIPSFIEIDQGVVEDLLEHCEELIEVL
jgi:hypothetical protein